MNLAEETEAVWLRHEPNRERMWVMKGLGKLFSIVGFLLAFSPLILVFAFAFDSLSIPLIISLAVLGSVFMIAGFILSFRAKAKSILSGEPQNIPGYAGGMLKMLGMGNVLETPENILGNALGTQSEDIKNGPLVTGKIVAVGQTGSSMMKRAGHQPKYSLSITLQFMTPGGQTVITTIQQWVMLTDIARIQAGASVPVRYNPMNPEQCMIDFVPGSLVV